MKDKIIKLSDNKYSILVYFGSLLLINLFCLLGYSIISMGIQVVLYLIYYCSAFLGVKSLSVNKVKWISILSSIYLPVSLLGIHYNIIVSIPIIISIFFVGRKFFKVFAKGLYRAFSVIIAIIFVFNIALNCLSFGEQVKYSPNNAYALRLRIENYIIVWKHEVMLEHDFGNIIRRQIPVGVTHDDIYGWLDNEHFYIYGNEYTLSDFIK